jgi:tRNA A-37 threonylcarbamoyl transferase component Bud32
MTTRKSGEKAKGAAASRIGKYEIIRELGRGAMGIVYEGRDPMIGRKVAIKTIRFDVLTRPEEQDEAQQRFIREARSAGILSHPSIVTIYDAGEDAGLTYIAMEYVEGGSLEALIAARTKLSLDEVTSLLAQVGDALDYAHREGIVHRDIKPGNILIDREGRPRIVDFGIAKIASSNLTQTNMVMGTPFYMAPEQIAGRKVDSRADIFSLGTVLYELLTFAKPFGGDTVTTVIYKIMNEQPPPPRTYDASLPPGLDYVVKKALAKDPARRYQSCRDLAADLRNHDAFARAAFSEAGPAPSGAGPARAAEPGVDAAEAEAVSSDTDVKPRKPLMLVLATMMAVVAIVIVILLMTGRGKRPTEFAGGGGAQPGTQAADATAKAAGQTGGTVLPEANSSSSEPLRKTEPVVDKRSLEITDRLQLARAALQKGSYDKSIEEARKVLALEPGQPEARETLALALLRSAPVQIGAMVSAYGDAIKKKALQEFFRANAAPELFTAVAADAQVLFEDHDLFQLNLSKPATEVIDNQDGTYRAEATFSEIMTALNKSRQVRVVLYEGKIKWRLERRDRWLITKIDYITTN